MRLHLPALLALSTVSAACGDGDATHEPEAWNSGDLESATAVEFGDIDGRVSDDAPRAVYRVDAAQDQAIYLQLLGRCAEGRCLDAIRFSLLAADGTVLEQVEDSGDDAPLWLDAAWLDAAAYYVVIERREDAAGPFLLRLIDQGIDRDGEHNATPVPLPVGAAPVDGRIWPIGDTDVYEFDAAPNQSIVVHARKTAGGAEVGYRVTGPDGAVLVETWGSAGAEATGRVVASQFGAHQIEILAGHGGHDTADYQVELDHW